jgi:hypothetical protein
MMAQTRRIRLSGQGGRLRLQHRGGLGRDPLEDLRECCRASMAMDKALGEAIRDASTAGARWQDISRTLGVSEAAQSESELIDMLAANRREVWRRYLD